GGIIYRSSLELKVLGYLDKNPSINRYASGSGDIKISYEYLDKTSIYYPDFYVEIKTLLFDCKRFIIDIVLEKSLNPPKENASVKEYKEYIKNMAKWKAADKICQKSNVEFVLLTDKMINQL